jgi:glycosyl-4,4'-diaponeurosporenoate acyltransferase
VIARPLLLAIDVAAWGVIHAGTGYLAHRLPDRCFARDTWLTRLRPFERSGRFFAATGVHRWKDRVPEAGDMFAGGVSKRHLGGSSSAALERFALLTRRAEFAHWCAAVLSPVFALWNPWWVALVMVGYGTAINAPFIVIQRYNRWRVERVLARRSSSAGASAGSRRRSFGTTGSSIP